MKEICYPYAYGSLDAKIGGLVNKLRIECSVKDIECSEKVFNMLEGMVNDMRDSAFNDAVKEQ